MSVQINTTKDVHNPFCKSNFCKNLGTEKLCILLSFNGIAVTLHVKKRYKKEIGETNRLSLQSGYVVTCKRACSLVVIRVSVASEVLGLTLHVSDFFRI